MRERNALGRVKKHTHTDIHQYGVVLIFLSFFCSRVCSLPQLALLPLKKKETTNRNEEEEGIHLITSITNNDE
jgi:hypothetical protein